MDNNSYESIVEAERQIAIGLGIVVLVAVSFSLYKKGKVFKYG